MHCVQFPPGAEVPEMAADKKYVVEGVLQVRVPPSGCWTAVPAGIAIVVGARIVSPAR